jgi:hypothetical protein
MYILVVEYKKMLGGSVACTSYNRDTISAAMDIINYFKKININTGNWLYLTYCLIEFDMVSGACFSHEKQTIVHKPPEPEYRVLNPIPVKPMDWKALNKTAYKNANQ